MRRRCTFAGPSWSEDQSAPLVAGHDFLVDYDIRRLPNCRQDYNGVQTWDVTVSYRFDGGAVQSASLTTSPNEYNRVQAPARIAAPRRRVDGGAVVREPRSHRLPDVGFGLRSELPLFARSVIK